MHAGAGSEEGAAESPPLQKSFGSLVAKNIIVLFLFQKINYIELLRLLSQ